MSSAREIEEAASDWLARRESDHWSADDEAALCSWLDAAVAHRVSFLRLQSVWRATQNLARADLPHRPSGRHRAALIAAAAAVVLLVAWIVVVPRAFDGAPGEYATTPVGGRATLTLADGSRLELNTNTRLRTRLGKHQRDVWLDRGEFFVAVAHDSRRPFSVHIGPRTVTALGTEFSVRSDGDVLKVFMATGAVSVTAPLAGEPRETTLRAGDVMVLDSSASRVAREDNAADALAWRRGMLVFQNTTLREAASEFNRYNRTQLLIADPRIADSQVSGSFLTSNLAGFARLLGAAYGYQVRAEGDRLLVSGAVPLPDCSQTPRSAGAVRDGEPTCNDHTHRNPPNLR